MKLLSEKLKSKRTKEFLTLFLTLTAAILTLIVPLYKITYDSIKTRVYKETESQVTFLADMIDSEIMMCHKMKGNFRNDPTYSMLKNMNGFDTSAQHIILKNFADDFSPKANMMPVNDYFYIFFNSNNVALDKQNTFDNIEPLFENYIKIDNMDYKQFRDYIFDADKGVTVKYFDNMEINGDKIDAIAVFYPVDMHIGLPPETVLMIVYNVESLFGKAGMTDYRETFCSVSLGGEVLYSNGGAESNTPVISAMCKNIDLIFNVKISDKYFDEYMIGFKRFILFYAIMLFAFIICMELFISWYTKKPVRRTVRLVSQIMGDKNIHSEEEMYKAIGRMKTDKRKSDKAFLLTMFLRPLDEAECAFIKKKYPAFPESFVMVLFLSENITAKILELLLSKNNIEYSEILSPKKGENVVIFDCTDLPNMAELDKKLDDIVFSVKKNGMDFTAVMGTPCNGIENFYYMYVRLKDYNRLIDHSGFFRLADNAENDGERNLDMSKSEKLREYIACGQAFEAKKIVYGQWYDIMADKSTANVDIERFFYSQIGIISEIAYKVRYNGEIAKYDPKIKVSELAFMIAADIDAICELINKRQSQYDEYGKVLEFIGANFNKVNFCMADVEEKFGITGKTVNKIVKSRTGRTFTEYVEEHRLEMVKKCLLESDDEVKAVSEKCGFYNYDTFYKFFKKHMGISPAKWRKMNISQGDKD